MTLVAFATLCAGLFAGAAVYVTLVEHPARLSCGTELAVREFGPSYKRAAVMQASLAVAGFLAAVGGWLALDDPWIIAGGALLGAIVPFTLVVILPTNRQLLDPSLESSSPRAAELLARWGRLHAVRTVLGVLAFLVLLARMA
jgi:anthrone oxygenase-like protein